MYSRERSFFVYIMSNRSKTLYTGITNNPRRRVWEHKCGVGSEFCKHYKLDRLVYLERFQYVGNAIAREKQIKGLLRIKKIALIVSQNPTWDDLAARWYDTPSWIKSASILRFAQDDKSQKKIRVDPCKSAAKNPHPNVAENALVRVGHPGAVE